MRQQERPLLVLGGPDATVDRVVQELSPRFPHFSAVVLLGRCRLAQERNGERIFFWGGGGQIYDFSAEKSIRCDIC